MCPTVDLTQSLCILSNGDWDVMSFHILSIENEKENKQEFVWKLPCDLLFGVFMLPYMTDALTMEKRTRSY